MTAKAHVDVETYSELDIRKVGGYRYARHQSTECLILRYLLPGVSYPREWLPMEEEPPEDLVAWVQSGGKLGAHNASFERNIWRYVLQRRFPELPSVADAQWECTAARAAASGLPRSLEKALAALDLPVQKDLEGSKLIQTFCKPRKPTKKDARTRIYPQDAPQAFARFSRYCATDVLGEAALDAALPKLRKREQLFFEMDLRMNDRGLPVDLPLVETTFDVVQHLEADVKAKVEQMSGGIKGTQVAKMLEMFSERGLDLENLRAETVRQALKDKDLDDDTRRLLELRLEAGKASTKKLKAILNWCDSFDFVVQGAFLIYGAHTGRYAGRGIQPQNFTRGMLKDHQRDLVFRLLALADAEVLSALYEKPIDIVSQCMRGFVMAPYGYEFAVVDYTAIEARVLAWVAGEEHMLDAYRKGVDVYKLMASKLWRISISDVSDEQRRIAKNLVLGCGYQLGYRKFVDYAANAGVIIDEEFSREAVGAYRKEHPAIVKSWNTVEKLCVAAIKNPGEVFEGLRCEFYMFEHWLCIRLPSGREIRYPYARVTATERWGKPHHQISFRTEIKGRFIRENTYGGKIIENIVQGIARDVMMEGLYNAERAKYPPVGTVHDEAITLRKVGTTDIKFLEHIVCAIPSWGDGIPLAAKGFTCVRYKKD